MAGPFFYRRLGHVTAVKVQIVSHPDYRGGAVVELDPAKAVEMLNRGEARAVPEQPDQDLEKRG